MKVLRSILLVFGGVAVVAAVAFAIWLATTMKRSVATLPDGTTIELLGTSVGSRQFSTEKPWEKFARRVLPQRFQSWIPQAHTSGCSSGSNSVSVFFRVRAPAGRAISQTPWEGYCAVDAGGFSVNRDGGYCSSGSGSEVFYGLILRNLPRRQKSFEFQFLGRTNDVLARFDVPVPAAAPVVEWTPEPLPITRTNGLLTVTLKSLTEAGSPHYRYLKADWNVVSTDPLWKNAKPGWINVSDATGNQGQFLFPGEPAWKLTTLVHRRNAADFTDAEKFTLSDLKMPEDGEVVLVNQTRQAAGVTVSVEFVTAPGRLTITNNLPPFLDPRLQGSSGGGSGSDFTNRYRYWVSESPALLVHTDGAVPNDDIRFTLREADGNEIKTQNNGYSTDPDGRREYYLRTSGPVVSKTFSLEVLVSHPLEFEFVVDPKEIVGRPRL